MADTSFTITPGTALPLGAHPTPHGVQFSLFSHHAREVRLHLYSSPEAPEPAHIISLDPSKHRTGDVWHIHIDGLAAGQLYLYQADGPQGAEAAGAGHRFQPDQPLLDPYAKALTARPRRPREGWWDFTTPSSLPRCVVVDDYFDWGEDRSLNYPLEKSIIYEAHVKGLSAHSRSGVSHPGTYRGIIETIPYLKDLGITSLELLPIHEFNPDEYPDDRVNYWGYSTIGFFAPAAHYAADQNPGGAVREFKEMVRELHEAGIEVILDIVFNHTAEGNEKGPILSFKGLDNSVYYILEKDRRYYKNFSGCGNTMNCNHPVVRTFILNCLRYWVMEMHVDGFRFDLGSILGRDSQGNLLENAPTIEAIAEDPILRNTKLIAEAWDAGGAYQVGRFHDDRWAEWNDRFRDDLRRFWAGEPGMTGALAMRFSGSADLYSRSGRKPYHSINFITSHDGFTLNDLVTYEKKHNEANGEKNRDGHGHNISRNYGVEGPTKDREIRHIRQQQIKNFLAALMLSSGTPMMTAGDEIRRTQRGNNNAYCQDNDLSWINWHLLRQPAGRTMLRFVRELTALRRRHPAFAREEFYEGRDINLNGLPDISWYGPSGKAVDWERAQNQLALLIDGNQTETLADRDDSDFYIIFNAEPKSQKFIIPPHPGGKEWKRRLDTALPSPRDILSDGEEEPLAAPGIYTAQPRSTVLLMT